MARQPNFMYSGDTRNPWAVAASSLGQALFGDPQEMRLREAQDADNEYRRVLTDKARLDLETQRRAEEFNASIDAALKNGAAGGAAAGAAAGGPATASPIGAAFSPQGTAPGARIGPVTQTPLAPLTPPPLTVGTSPAEAGATAGAMAGPAAAEFAMKPSPIGAAFAPATPPGWHGYGRDDQQPIETAPRAPATSGWHGYQPVPAAAAAAAAPAPAAPAPAAPAPAAPAVVATAPGAAEDAHGYQPSPIGAAFPPPAAGAPATAVAQRTPQFNMDDYLKFLMQRESSGGTKLTTTGSSAAGNYAFTEGTWRDMGGQGSVLQASPEEQKQRAEDFSWQNYRSLARVLGREPTYAELYAAHHFGATGGAKVINAGVDTPFEQAVSPQAMDANDYLRGQTVGDWFMKANADFPMQWNGELPQEAVAPAAAPAAAMPAPMPEQQAALPPPAPAPDALDIMTTAGSNLPMSTPTSTGDMSMGEPPPSPIGAAFAPAQQAALPVQPPEPPRALPMSTPTSSPFTAPAADAQQPMQQPAQPAAAPAAAAVPSSQPQSLDELVQSMSQDERSILMLAPDKRTALIQIIQGRMAAEAKAGKDQGPWGGLGMEAQARNKVFNYESKKRRGEPTTADEFKVYQEAQQYLGTKNRIPADIAGKMAMAKRGLIDLQAAKDALIDPKTGEVNDITSMATSMDVPGTPGHTAYNRLSRGIETIVRVASGAAVPEPEIARYQAMFLPSWKDSDEDIKDKMQAAQSWLQAMYDNMEQGRGTLTAEQVDMLAEQHRPGTGADYGADAGAADATAAQPGDPAQPAQPENFDPAAMPYQGDFNGTALFSPDNETWFNDQGQQVDLWQMQ